MVINDKYPYSSHFAVWTDIELLYCIPENHISSLTFVESYHLQACLGHLILFFTFLSF